MFFEEPAWLVEPDGTEWRLYWTDNAALNWTQAVPFLPNHRWYHVKPTAIHELGHTLGLPDLNGTPHRGVMSNPLNWPGITSEDQDYLLQIYYGHVDH